MKRNATLEEKLTGMIHTHPQTDVTLRMDYKLILESQYVTNRICELAGSAYEIGFVYGGTVQKEKTDTYSRTTIEMDRILIPKLQKVTQTTFDFDYSVFREIDTELKKTDRQIVGQGHSHQHMGVFHSGVDMANYARMTLNRGTKITPHEKTTTEKVLTSISSFSKRLKQTVEKVKNSYKTMTQKPEYVFPTLVFNTHGDIAKGLAMHNTKRLTVVEDVPITYYNKNAILTQDDRRRLDRSIYGILEENNIPFTYALAA